VAAKNYQQQDPRVWGGALHGAHDDKALSNAKNPSSSFGEEGEEDLEHRGT
jgi:hypothetical protein